MIFSVFSKKKKKKKRKGWGASVVLSLEVCTGRYACIKGFKRV